MKALWGIVFLSAAAALGGCGPGVEAASADGAKGRYLGVAVYEPGRMWEQIVRAANPDAKAATPKDDEKIIVVTDSLTGEIRQCGNLSGACISMKPWEKPSVEVLGAPVAVTKHVAELEAEAAK